MDSLVSRLKRKSSYIRSEDWKYNIDKNTENDIKLQFHKDFPCEEQKQNKKFQIDEDDNTREHLNKEFVRRQRRISTLNFNQPEKKNNFIFVERNSVKSEKDFEIPLEFLVSPHQNTTLKKFSDFSPKKDRISLEKHSKFENSLISEEENKDSPEISLYSNVSDIIDEAFHGDQVGNADFKGKHSKKLSVSFENATIIGIDSYSPVKSHNLLNKTFDMTVSLARRDMNTLATNENYDFSNEKMFNSTSENPIKTLKSSIIEKFEVSVLGFEESIHEFHCFSASYTDQNIWLRPWHSFLSSCCMPLKELPEKKQEICEKFIIFSYTSFSENEYFHRNLLATVSYLLKKRVDANSRWSDIGFSSNSPVSTDLNHHVALSGLLFLIFLDKYFPITLTEILFHSIRNEIAFILLAFDIAEIVIISLRRFKLHEIMLESEKCLEIIFFLFAGCIGFWFSVHKDNNKLPSAINLMCEKTLNKNPYFFISLAKQLLKNQVMTQDNKI